MTVWQGNERLVLASQSRARQLLLANAGIDFETIPADIDERAAQQSAGLSAPADIAALLARAKAVAVSIQKPARYVVGADQTLALGQRLFNKPSGRAEAAEQLRGLAGRTHELNSAVAVAHGGEIVFVHVALARMTVRPLNEVEIEAYLDRAGAGGYVKRRRLPA